MLSLRTFSAFILHEHFQNVLTIIIWIRNEAITASQTWSSARPLVCLSAPVRPLHLWKALSGLFWIQMMTMRTFSACTLHKHFQNVLTIIIWIQNEAPTISQTWSSARSPVRPSAHVRPLYLWKALSGSFRIQMLSLRTFSTFALHKHFQNVLIVIIWIRNEAPTASQPPVRPCPTPPPLEGPIRLIFDPKVEFEDIFGIYVS